MLSSSNQGKETVAPVLRVAGASDHVFHRILTIQSLKRHSAVLRSTKSQTALISFVVSARPSVRQYHCGSHRQDLRGIWQWQLLRKICRETSNLVRNAKRHQAVNKYTVHTQVCLS